MENKTYLAIDLKSFYASVECMERGLDPMTTNLVVADQSRTEKTICLAVSPSLKAYGIPGRPRLFEVIEKIKQVNICRQSHAPGRKFAGSSTNSVELSIHPELSVDYIVAPPQMARYMEISGEIYRVYLKYAAPEDIHVYSIDEIFMDVTGYLKTNRMTAKEMAMKIILDVLSTTGITATAGIGTNLYLAKVAMDIEAKHIQADKNGVRIAELEWLVCVKGEYFGQSFALKAGNNGVGRAMNMDVPLAQEPTVSRNKHCIITFEPQSQVFYIQQGESSGLTYLNDEMVMSPHKMAARDRIRLGKAEFILIPLCTDGFRWEEYMNTAL
ncbi:MAG TPA: FHA domain-containing protein [Firmicutes bacterium]|nr:FHA domain-containing protein [Bacillota bacterium]